MAVEIWVTILLKVIFVIIAGHIAITKIVPLLNEFLLSFIKNQKAVDSFTSLIDIYILTLVGLKIVTFTLETEHVALKYVEILQPALEVIYGVFNYLQWILLALLVVIALKNYKA
mgnify:CR=1 FL=1